MRSPGKIVNLCNGGGSFCCLLLAALCVYIIYVRFRNLSVRAVHSVGARTFINLCNTYFSTPSYFILVLRAGLLMSSYSY